MYAFESRNSCKDANKWFASEEAIIKCIEAGGKDISISLTL